MQILVSRKAILQKRLVQTMAAMNKTSDPHERKLLWDKANYLTNKIIAYNAFKETRPGKIIIGLYIGAVHLIMWPIAIAGLIAGFILLSMAYPYKWGIDLTNWLKGLLKPKQRPNDAMRIIGRMTGIRIELESLDPTDRQCNRLAEEYRTLAAELERITDYSPEM